MGHAVDVVGAEVDGNTGDFAAEKLFRQPGAQSFDKFGLGGLGEETGHGVGVYQSLARPQLLPELGMNFPDTFKRVGAHLGHVLVARAEQVGDKLN